ncbi:hypothetical protein, partial [Klebsiella pneumoniae]|uniref:hypothetical protein n=1 Tax=Klebsiella pneumoniae TaxID=573 RepID=UPI001C60B141
DLRPLKADALFCVSLYLFLFFPPYYAPIPSWPSCCYGCQHKMNSKRGFCLTLTLRQAAE